MDQERAGFRPSELLTRLALGIVAAGLLSLATLQATPVRAVDPTPPAALTPAPAPPTPTCSERYPADGPAGVDLLLGCVVSELVRYVGGLGGGLEPVREPPRLTAYLFPLAVVVAAIASILLVVRVARRDAGRRLAPAVPTAWWSCPACRSLNASGKPACYRCGHVFEPGATELRVDAEPPAPQSFGIRFDRVVDRSGLPPEPSQPAPRSGPPPDEGQPGER